MPPVTPYIGSVQNHNRGACMQRLVSLFLLSCLSMCLLSCEKEKQGYQIGITQHRPASWADSVRSGFEKGLLDAGWKAGKDFTITFKSADGDPRVMRQIASQFQSEKLDLVFAISTQSAQTEASMERQTPVLFGAVTDPVAAGLVKSLTSPGGNITGTSDQWPVDQQLLLLRELVPSVHRVGVVHNPGESNSVAQLKIIRAVTQRLGWELAVATATTPAEVYRATQSLAGKCDALYVSADNTAIEAADAMAKVATELHVPIVAGEESSVQKGAIATYSVNYVAIGRLNAQQAVRILRDKVAPSRIPVAVPTDYELVINPAAAAKIGIPIPTGMRARAVRVIQ